MRAFRYAAFAAAATLGVQVLNLVASVLSAHLLGPRGRGVLAAAQLFPTLIGGLASLGLPEAVLYFGAARPAQRGALMATLTYPLLGIAIAATGIGWVVAPVVVGHDGDDAILVMRVCLITIPTTLIGHLLINLLVSAERSLQFNGMRLSVPVTVVMGYGAMLVFSRHQVALAGLVWSAGSLAALILGLAHVHAAGWLALRPRLNHLGELVGYSLKGHIGTVFGYINDRLDLALIAILLPAAQVGYYSIATNAAGVIAVIGTSVVYLVVGRIGGALEPVAAATTLARLSRLALLSSTLVALVLAPFIGILVRIVFGGKFEPATAAAAVLLFAGAVQGTRSVLSQGLRSLNRPLASSVAEFAAAVVTAVLLLILLPRFGIVGAAAASLLAYAFAAWLMARRLTEFDLRLVDVFVPRTSDIRYLWAASTELVRRR